MNGVIEKDQLEIEVPILEEILVVEWAFRAEAVGKYRIGVEVLRHFHAVDGDAPIGNVADSGWALDLQLCFAVDKDLFRDGAPDALDSGR